MADKKSALKKLSKIRPGDEAKAKSAIHAHFAKKAREGFDRPMGAPSAHGFSRAAQEGTEIAEKSARIAAITGDTYHKTAAKRDHALAGESHIRAANAHFEGRLKTGERESSLASHREHMEKAAAHAKEAGSEWDDSKHPRDESGKFS